MPHRTPVEILKEFSKKKTIVKKSTMYFSENENQNGTQKNNRNLIVKQKPCISTKSHCIEEEQMLSGRISFSQNQMVNGR